MARFYHFISIYQALEPEEIYKKKLKNKSKIKSADPIDRAQIKQPSKVEGTRETVI